MDFLSDYNALSRNDEGVPVDNPDGLPLNLSLAAQKKLGKRRESNQCACKAQP